MQSRGYIRGPTNAMNSPSSTDSERDSTAQKPLGYVFSMPSISIKPARNLSIWVLQTPYTCMRLLGQHQACSNSALDGINTCCPLKWKSICSHFPIHHRDRTSFCLLVPGCEQRVCEGTPFACAVDAAIDAGRRIFEIASAEWATSRGQWPHELGRLPRETSGCGLAGSRAGLQRDGPRGSGDGCATRPEYGEQRRVHDQSDAVQRLCHGRT